MQHADSGVQELEHLSRSLSLERVPRGVPARLERFLPVRVGLSPYPTTRVVLRQQRRLDALAGSLREPHHPARGARARRRGRAELGHASAVKVHRPRSLGEGISEEPPGGDGLDAGAEGVAAGASSSHHSLGSSVRGGLEEPRVLASRPSEDGIHAGAVDARGKVGTPSRRLSENI